MRGRFAHLFALSLLSMLLCNVAQADALQAKMLKHLYAITDDNGIGAREAGSAEEQRAAKYIASEWQQQGYDVQQHPFTYTHNNQTQHSQNVSVRISGTSDQILLIGAHYDSTGKGSNGVIDNGAAVALLLTLSESLRSGTLPVTVQLVMFGAEEVSLQGAKAFVNNFSAQQKSQLIGMINLDTIVGGDTLYIHSAHSTPYNCPANTNRYQQSALLRDALLTLAKGLSDTPHALHPAYDGYPQGETGAWSDHAPFACAGVPIAYLEATNFAIRGKDGFDGYSQSTHAALWNCFDTDSQGACSPADETRWGHIWHTQNDRLDVLESLFPGRIEAQLQSNLQLLMQFLQPDALQAYTTAVASLRQN